MKQTTILKTVLGALVFAFALTGCKGTNEQKLTSLTVKPAAITLTPGESTRLAIITEPADVKVSVNWASSDTNVVVVDGSGVVTAIEVGTANVTASTADGEFKGVCAVTVKEYFETLAFTGAFVYDFDTIEGNVFDTLSNPESWGEGVVYYAKKVACNMMIFSEGFYINDEGHFAGADKGAILEFEAPMYWAPAWANGGSGTIFCLGDWIITNDTVKYPEGTTTVGKPFEIDEENFTDNINAYVQHRYVEDDATQASKDLQTAATYVTGAQLRTYEYHSTEEGYPSDGYFSAYIPDLLFGEGALELGDNYVASGRMCSVDAYQLTAKELKYEVDEANNDIYLYGAHFRETETSIDLVDNKVYYGQEYNYSRGTKSSAPSRFGRKSEFRPIPVREFTPAQKALIREQLNRKNVMVNK